MCELAVYNVRLRAHKILEQTPQKNFGVYQFRSAHLMILEHHLMFRIELPSLNKHMEYWNWKWSNKVLFRFHAFSAQSIFSIEKKKLFKRVLERYEKCKQNEDSSKNFDNFCLFSINCKLIEKMVTFKIKQRNRQ